MTSRTRGGAKEFKLYKAHAQKLPRDGKLPTQLEVSLAVSFELQNTQAAFNLHDAMKKLDTKKQCNDLLLGLNKRDLLNEMAERRYFSDKSGEEEEI